MSYVQPNSTIILMKGVPLNNTYNDTYYFSSVGDQDALFSTFANKTFSAQSYQRVNKNTIRLQVNAEEVYSFNYLRFKNTAYGNKWFYAFILECNYINDNVTEIVYEIDVMQTYVCDYTILPSLVEREHSVTDEVGDNILPEPIDIGRIVCMDVEESIHFTSYSVVAFKTPRRFDDE